MQPCYVGSHPRAANQVSSGNDVWRAGGRRAGGDQASFHAHVGRVGSPQATPTEGQPAGGR